MKNLFHINVPPSPPPLFLIFAIIQGMANYCSIFNVFIQRTTWGQPCNYPNHRSALEVNQIKTFFTKFITRSFAIFCIYISKSITIESIQIALYVMNRTSSSLFLKNVWKDFINWEIAVNMNIQSCWNIYSNIPWRSK